MTFVAVRSGDVAVKVEPEPCEFCGARKLFWRKCKLICSNCQQINKSCSDL